jgi:hypothetical protein
VPQQDVYMSLSDCQRDWPAAGQCMSVSDARYPSSFYYGPVHCNDTELRPSVNAIAVVARGGFGCMARRYSSGG